MHARGNAHIGVAKEHIQLDMGRSKMGQVKMNKYLTRPILDIDKMDKPNE